MRRAFSIAVFVALAVQLVAMTARQRPAQSPGTGLILGQVIDATTGKGIAGVMVTLGAPQPASPPTAELLDMGTPPALAGRRALTFADGRFLFRDLPKGRYALAASSPGYVPATYGQGRPSGPSQFIDLDDAQALGDVSVRMWKYGAISGTVVDERGDPAVGVSVRAMRRVIAGGKPRFLPTIGATTDDRGSYRASGLVPGDYVVGVLVNQQTVPMTAVSAYIDASQAGNLNASPDYQNMSHSAATVGSSAAGFRLGDLVLRTSGGLTRPAPAADGIMTYQSQFYPTAIAPSQASLVALGSGEDRQNVDLQLRLVPAVKVSGRVTGPGGAGAFLGISLVPPSGSDLQSEGSAEAASTVTDAAGAFTFLAVPTGQYLLKIRMYPRAVAGSTPTPTVLDGVPLAGPPSGRGGPPAPPPAEPTLWAIVPVAVGDTDISDLGVTLKPGITVSGRVEFAGTRPAATNDQIQRMAITLQSAEGRTSAPIAAQGRATPDGAFRTAGYAGGRYIVTASTLPPGWTLKSIMSAGRDVSIEPLELSDADVTGVVITFTDQTTELSGTVTGASGPDANAEVIVFPADSLAWKEIGVAARRGRNERLSKTGAFTVSGLPAGDYFVAAVSSAAIIDWRDPRLLETLMSGATRVTLADGEKRAVNLKTLTVPRR